MKSIWRNQSRALLYFVVFVALAMVLLAFWRTHPMALAKWSQKGTAFDLIGPTVLLIGSLAGLFLARYRRANGLPGYRSWLAYSIILWFLMMEEIGWGFEVLRFARPEVGGIPVDSVHDLTRLVRRVRNSELIVLLQVCSVALILCGLWFVWKETGRRLLRKISPSIATILVLAMGSMFWAAVLDVRIVDIFWFLRRNPAYELEESLELLGELMFALVVFDGWASLPRVHPAIVVSNRAAAPSAEPAGAGPGRRGPAGGGRGLRPDPAPATASWRGVGAQAG